MMNNVLVRIGIYYAACFAFFGALFRVFPKILYYVTLERTHSVRSATMDFNAGTVLGPGGNVEGLSRLVDPMNSVPVPASKGSTPEPTCRSPAERIAWV